MQNVQRHFGRYMKRSADDQQVSLLLKDFEDADQLLTKLIEEARRWRESWISILTHQHRMFSEFELLYAPIIGAGDDHQGHVAVETPELLLSRTRRINTECEELKTDLREILDQVDVMMVKPAQEAKDSLHLLRKPIKKREDKKLDFERYQSRVDASMKKKGRSDRDNVALLKAEKDLAVATEQYKTADENLTNTLPRILHAVYSLQPHLLAAQVQIQNSLLGHYYTSLHNFCTDEGFPSPAPPMDEVVKAWEEVYKQAQANAESMNMIANGKLVRNVQANGYRRPSQNSTGRGHSVSPARPIHAPIPAESMRPKISSSASSSSLLSAHTNSQPEPLPIPSPSHSVYATPTSSYAPAGPNADYFSRERSTSNTHNNSTNGSSTALSSAIAAKKKPPPPPPRLPSQQFQFVTALYDFGGQGDGDLIFKEGDRIRIIKKTDSTDDWWQGELRGIKGMFPANYCS